MGVAPVVEPGEQAQTIDETVPLLSSSKGVDPPVNKALRRRVFIALLAMICILDLGAVLGASPATQIYEEIICWNHYNDISKNPSKMLDKVPRDCKIEPVQSELAFLTGWMDTVQMTISIIFTLPFGALADRTSRRLVIGLAIFGLVCFELSIRIICWFPHIFPLRLTWGGALFVSIGGGSQVAIALCYAIVAEYVNPEERSNVFLRMNGIVIVVEIFASALSGALMRKSPWIPFISSIPIEAACLPLLSLVPPEKHEPQSLLPDNESSNKPSTLKERIISTLNTAYRFIADNIWVFILLLPWVSIFYTRHPFVLIYAAKKYQITFSDATFLVNVRNIIAFVMMIFVLPWGNNILSRRYRMSPLNRDLLTTRVASILLVLGVSIIGLSTSIPVFTVGLLNVGFGSCFIVALRCVVTHLVPQEALGTLYTSIGLIQSLGMMAQGPVVAALFKQGLKIGVTGLPYYFVACLFAINAAIVTFTPIPKDQIEVGDDLDDGEPQS